MNFDEYNIGVDQVYKSNPIIKLKELFGDDLEIDSYEFINIMISIKKSWETYKNYNVQCGIIIESNTELLSHLQIRGYDFTEDIKSVIQNGNHKSIIYVIDNKGNIIRTKFFDEVLKYEYLINISKTQNKIVFYLGINGIDVLINGVLFEGENRLENYSDVINYKKLIDISQYKQLLNKFFLERVQYDPFKSFFVHKSDTDKARHSLLEQHPKLLQKKPEERFQRELEYFLKNNCIDEVKTEMRNRFGERFDVWIATSDDRFYVFEIKWLGKSITSQGTVFQSYNDPERATEGAYQLKKYIDDAEEYSQIIDGEFRIFCGVLVTYDARENMDTLVFPEVFSSYPQLDLYQQFKIDKENVPASQYYSKVIKKAE